MTKKVEIFTSKTNVLKYLQPKLRKSSIEKIFDFTLKEWRENNNLVIQEIQKRFKNEKIIVRSSAIGEDSFEKSNAGSYSSIQNIDTRNKNKIKNAIGKVIQSYEKNYNYQPDNQILIQTQTNKIKISGVLFTKNPDNGGPYYIINYEESSHTDGVTKGNVNQSVKIFKKTPKNFIPKKWIRLLKSINEIENLVKFHALDIEFGILESDEIVIFQVRPLTSVKKIITNNLDSKINKMINKNIIKFLKQNKKNDLGKFTIFSDMADWNPAEIIGSNPHLLDYSLYDFLIMDKIWCKGREKIGYQKINDSKLMQRFGNKPYVDIRSSFNSLIPENIPKHLRKKLINYYLKKLKANPFLHDKVEFEILFTCYDFKIDKRLKELLDYGFDINEINELKLYLIEFTNSIINKFSNILDETEKSKNNLSANRKKIESQLNKKILDNKLLIKSIEKLIVDCKKFGTLPFATMARISFISSILLKTIPKNKYISENFSENFLHSIETPISKIQDDVEKLLTKKISKNDFLSKYGHLRPGTYDITISRYNEQKEFFENLKFLKRSKIAKLTYNKKNINKILVKSGLTFSEKQYFEFIKKSIMERENLKFEFTKNLSLALELISKLGENLGFERNELCHLDINMIINSKNLTDQKIKEKLKKLILKEMNYHNQSNLMVLPPIIFSKNDFYNIEYFISKPNFITTKQISDDVVVLENLNKKNLEIENKIVLIENADPGYDWIFTRNPKALVTKYGGVASHMSIRCYELSLPAAIGCGEILFEKLKNSEKILLDCQNKQVITLVKKNNDEEMEIKKTLRSLGYMK